MDITDDFDSAFADATADSAPAVAPAAAPEVNTVTTEGVQPPAESAHKDQAEPSTDLSTPAADPDPAADPVKPAADPAPPADPAKPAEPAPKTTPDTVDAPAAPLPKPVQQPQQPQAQQPQQPLDPKYLAQAIAEAQRLNTEQAQQAQKPAAPVKKTQADYLTAEQNAAIDRFKQDWPDEYSALMPLFNAQVQAELSNYRSDLTAELNQILAPLFQTVGTVEVNSHRNTLLAAHPDIDSLDTNKVREWIDTQPALFRPTMLAAFEKGTAKDVVELLTMYKQSTGVTSAAPATPASLAQTKPAAVPAAPKQPVDPAAKAALAAVPAAQRQQPSARPGDDDFDAAFAEAVGQG